MSKMKILKNIFKVIMGGIFSGKGGDHNQPDTPPKDGHLVPDVPEDDDTEPATDVHQPGFEDPPRPV